MTWTIIALSCWAGGAPPSESSSWAACAAAVGAGEEGSDDGTSSAEAVGAVGCGVGALIAGADTLIAGAVGVMPLSLGRVCGAGASGTAVVCATAAALAQSSPNPIATPLILPFTNCI